MPSASRLSRAALLALPLLGAAAHAAPAARVEFDPAFLDEPAFEAGDQASGFAWRTVRGDFIFTVELKGDAARGPIGLRAQAGDVAFEVMLDKNGVLAAHDGQAGAAALLHPDVFQVERSGGQLRFSAAAFGEPLRQVATAALPADQPLKVGVLRHAGVAMRNARWTVPAWPGLTPYKDYLGSRLELLDVRTGAREVVFATAAGIEAPNFTPDGKNITFNSGGRIYRMDVGTHAVSAIDTGKCVRNNNDHVISPDGKWLGISCHTEAFDGQSVVYKVPLEGGTPIALTHAAPSYLHGWSPDGGAIIFTGSRNGEFDIYRTSTDGAGKETKLTSGPALDDGSEYSRDGRHIYFNSTRSGKMQLWRMNADGGDPLQLTRDAFNNWFPHLSPDQRTIVFLSYQPDMQPDQHPYYQHVYLRAMPAAGGAPRVVAYLYGGQGTINVPSWSPDGVHVAFVTHTAKP